MGRLMSWQTVSPNLANSSTVTIQLKQTYAWVNSLAPCQIATDRPTDTLFLSSELIKSITYQLGAQLVLAYRSTNLIPLVSGLKAWSIIAYINLAVRNDSGQICLQFAGAQLYSTSNINNNCTLAFSTTAVGYYVVSQDSADYFPILALILGIGIPLCLMLNILSCSCLPQWLDQTFLYVNYIIFVFKEI
ncbi:unnamed protein product [Rotaria socialis]|uniref:Uncharacterized protein n=1 Tax=Rotaria socialis TaxID=392032 RepID=A0A820KMR5_9BILA|nr:unnamed protein product [Rotaria socialis]CAF4431299.1 unnamed protein product [Rotaria socialis]